MLVDLEPNSTLAVPSESGTNLTIYASTQAPTKTQDFCARVTNTPACELTLVHRDIKCL